MAEHFSNPNTPNLKNIKHVGQIPNLPAIVEQSQYAFAIADLSGRIEYANPVFYTLTGLSPETILEKNLTNINIWNDFPDEYQRLLASLDARQVWEGECCSKKSTGELYWEYVTISPILDLLGEVVCFSRVSSDVTARKKALGKIEEAYFDLDQILKSLGEGICVTDLTGKIIRTNTFFAQMCGLDQSCLPGLNSCTLFPAHPYCGTNECCVAKISRGQTTVEREIQFADKTTGKMKYWLITVTPFYDMAGKLVGLVKNYRDITDKIELQENLRRAGDIQKYFIPKIEDDNKVIFETIYEPYLHASGDVIDFGWNSQKTILYGYIVDVMGHGIATALQTSALRVLFRQTFNDHMLPGEKLNWINQESGPYFAEDSFAAAIYFEFDFDNRLLRYSAAGLNHFVANTNTQNGLIGIPGSLLGIGPTLYYDEGQINFAPGDYFCFISDGLLDILGHDKIGQDMKFADFVNFLRTTANSNIRKDDASAICIYIR